MLNRIVCLFNLSIRIWFVEMTSYWKILDIFQVELYNEYWINDEFIQVKYSCHFRIDAIRIYLNNKIVFVCLEEDSNPHAFSTTFWVSRVYHSTIKAFNKLILFHRIFVIEFSSIVEEKVDRIEYMFYFLLISQ